MFVWLILSRIMHLPADACYYETHHAPPWIVRYYMDEGYHVGREGNLFMAFLEVMASAVASALVCLLMAGRPARRKSFSKNSKASP